MFNDTSICAHNCFCGVQNIEQKRFHIQIWNQIPVVAEQLANELAKILTIIWQFQARQIMTKARKCCLKLWILWAKISICWRKWAETKFPIWSNPCWVRTIAKVWLRLYFMEHVQCRWIFSTRLLWAVTISTILSSLWCAKWLRPLSFWIPWGNIFVMHFLVNFLSTAIVTFSLHLLICKCFVFDPNVT